jgi:DNA primase
MLYNFDTASKQPYVVVVEGVPSVWRIGPAAVCLFGKTMSLYQQTTIATTWGRKPVVLMLDHDAKAEMEQGTAALKARGVDVRPVFLPDSRDPADYDAVDIEGLISNAL